MAKASFKQKATNHEDSDEEVVKSWNIVPKLKARRDRKKLQQDLRPATSRQGQRNKLRLDQGHKVRLHVTPAGLRFGIG